MGETNYTIDQDIKELRAMVDVLDPYVYENQLFKRIGGSAFSTSNMPYMTIGSVLLRLRRLDAVTDQMTEAQRRDFQAAEAVNQRVYDAWTTHYRKKMVEEGLSRLKTMHSFFNDCKQSLRDCANGYRPEAWRRTVVEELYIALDEMNEPSAEFDSARRTADGLLRGFVRKGDFIWDSALQPVYPEKTFWWLYGKPEAN